MRLGSWGRKGGKWSAGYPVAFLPLGFPTGRGRKESGIQTSSQLDFGECVFSAGSY